MVRYPLLLTIININNWKFIPKKLYIGEFSYKIMSGIGFPKDPTFPSEFLDGKVEVEPVILQFKKQKRRLDLIRYVNGIGVGCIPYSLDNFTLTHIIYERKASEVILQNSDPVIVSSK